MNEEKKLKKVLNKGNINYIHTYFEEIYNTYKGLVCFVVSKYINSREDIFDIAQEVFLDFFNNAENINTSIKFYLTTSAKNKSLNYLKKNERITLIDLETIDLLDEKSIENDYLFNNILKSLKQNLSDKEYNILILHIFDNYTFKELETKLNIKESTIKSIYFRTLKKCKNILKGE